MLKRVLEVREISMDHFLDWRDFEDTRAEKFFKITLWQGQHVMVGMNCFEPGQTQSVHAHQDADKFYFVLQGAGKFTVGDETREAAEGMLVIAPAGVPHGVQNSGSEKLSVLVGIAPPMK